MKPQPVFLSCNNKLVPLSAISEIRKCPRHGVALVYYTDADLEGEMWSSDIPYETLERALLAYTIHPKGSH